jgi:DNA-binding transcriptional ArsR family regulator
LCGFAAAGAETMKAIDEQAFQQIAQYFQALSEQSRLKLLFALRSGERNVTELTESSGCSQANVSKHMALLMKAGFVQREMRGTCAYYRIADPDIFALCNLVSGKIANVMAAQGAIQTVLRNFSLQGKKIIARKRASTAGR